MMTTKLFVARLRMAVLDGQGNQVRILNGTAAVYGEAAHRDESPSLGNREDRAPLLIRQSEDLLAAMLSPLRALRRRMGPIAGNRPRQWSIGAVFLQA